MNNIENSVQKIIEGLGTRGDEDAFHNLIELGPEVVPILMSTFRDEQRATIRTRLIEAISQFRDLVTVEFLAGAWDDSDASVWKASLDALVTLGGPAVMSALQRAQQREMRSGDKSTDRLEWISEALQQTGDGLR